MTPVLIDKNGVSIYVQSREHLPPHIHAFSGDAEALVNIRTGQIIEGYLSGKKLIVVQEWLDEGNNRTLTEQNFYELNPRLKPTVENQEVKKTKRKEIMKNKTYKRLPKILKINRIEKNKLRISVLFSDGEDRILDFNKIFEQDWKVTKTDPEYKLLIPAEFAKVKIVNHTLSWNNVDLSITGANGKKVKVPFEVGADTLYDLSEADEKLTLSIGALFKSARLAAKLSQEKVAELSGTSRTYITKLESDGHDVEIMTLKKIVQAGLNKHLNISID